MKLEDLRPKQNLVGVVPGCVVSVIQAEMKGADACLLTYRLPEGGLGERQVFRSHEAELHEAQEARPWSFTGDPSDLQLAVEALRIRLAHLFDPMMAVHSSNVDPLPHQITAVYESLLPRQPLRFVLADDPGAGKTVMAGLYIRELIMRADARRVMVVAPGSLVEQWREELREKFSLDFPVYSKDLELASPTNNAFESHDRIIVRLDQLSRSTDLQELACSRSWDLIVFDEAHKLAAHFYGQKTQETARFKMARKLGDHTRHLLLMTATPHNGKEEDFQLFLSLLDADRFAGKFRDGAHQVDTTDLMRRMVKEELLKFDGTPLFPERRAYTVNYALSPQENDLYEDVTRYVREQMGKADQLEEYVDNVFSLLHDFFGSTWGLITDLLKTSKSADTSIALPNISQRFKMFYFKTPSAKRAKFIRKKADVPYNMQFIGGGADTFSVTDFQGVVGGKDIFEFYPGFHRGNLALYGVSKPFKVNIMSTVEIERRTASGGLTGVLEKQLFLASMKIHPVDGDRPELEFEWAKDGSSFIVRNFGRTKVDITLNILNSFDPYLVTGTEDELNELRNQLDIPNRKKFESLLIGGGEILEIFFSQWWNYQNGSVTLSFSRQQNNHGGCSCKFTGNGPDNAALGWILGILALGFYYRKKIRGR